MTDSYQAALAKQAAARLKKSKREDKAAELWKDRPKRVKSKSGSKLEMELWKAFSDWIRAKPHDFFPSKPQGMEGLCWYCVVKPIECAGHVISRRRRAVKYDERNVFASCLSCNWADKFVPGRHDQMVTLYIDRWGIEQWKAILELSKATCPRSKVDMAAKTLEYRAKLAALKGE